MKSIQRLVMAVVVLGLIATAFAQRGRDGTVNLIYWQAISHLNPYLSSGTKEINGSSLVIEPLVRYDDEGRYVPWLVTELPTIENGGVAADFTSISYTLLPGLLWSDGTPVTSRDVEFSWQYCVGATGCASAGFFSGISHFTIHDDSSFTIHFDAPKPVPYSAFVGQQSPVIQAAQFANCMGEAAQTCTEQNFYPIGTGPFVSVDFRPNDVATFNANPNYRVPDQPAFATLVIKGGGDAASAARAVLETGEADWAWNIQIAPEVLAQMESAGRGVAAVGWGTSMERIMFQWTDVHPSLGENRGEIMGGLNPHPFLTDIRVRQALAMAIDQEILVEVGYGSTGRVTCAAIPAPEAIVPESTKGCEAQDIEGAKALLESAGWVLGNDGVRVKDGVRLSVLYQTSTNAVRQNFQALVQEWWREIGVAVELKNADAGVFFGNDVGSPDTYGKFWADVQMYTSSASGTDFQGYIDAFLCDSASQRANNWLGENNTRYCNPEFDAVYDELTRTAGIDERNALLARLNEIVVQDYAIVPLVFRGDVAVRANSLLGTAKNPWDSELWNAAEWYRGN
ncbi:MAG: peptide ABC transporter substrate-binding protein [Trueperaceae bacterium]|nr:peptide ABC transporter substrate-binding protein [Trueperaceae bacterium]